MDDDGVHPTLANRLDHLFSVQGGRKGREPTYREVATAIADRGGPTVSPSYIWQLRTGLKDNPTLKHLEALANYFGVTPAYFFDAEAAERIDADHALSAALADPSVRSVALSASELSPESLAVIRAVIDRTSTLERNAKPDSTTNARRPARKRLRGPSSGDVASTSPSC